MHSSPEQPAVHQHRAVRRVLQCASSRMLVLGAALLRWCSVHMGQQRSNKKKKRSSSGSPTTEDTAVTTPFRRSPVSGLVGKVHTEQQQQEPARPNRRVKKPEESVIGIYTEDNDDNDVVDDDDDSTTASPTLQHHHDTMQRHHQHHMPEESYIMSEFSVLYAGGEPSRILSSRRGSTYGDEVSIADYSMAAFDDATTTVPPPLSFRYHHHTNNNTNRQRMSDSVVSASTKTLPMVVQRIVKAPPGKLGITLHVTKEGPKVQTVKTNSPLDGLLFPGDLVIAVNDTDIRFLTLNAIHKVLEQHTNDLSRTITVLTLDDVTTRKNVPTSEERIFQFI